MGKVELLIVVFTVAATFLGIGLYLGPATESQNQSASLSSSLPETKPSSVDKLSTNAPRSSSANASAQLSEREELLILKTKSELFDAAYNRLEILLAGLGLLLTAIIVFFAFRTERQAIASARNEISKEKKEIFDRLTEDIREDIDKARTLVRVEAAGSISQLQRLLAQAQSLTDRIKSHKEDAEQIAASINTSLDRPDSNTQTSLSVSFQDTDFFSTRPESERDSLEASSGDDLHLGDLPSEKVALLIEQKLAEKDWHGASDIAITMRMLHRRTQDTVYALFMEAVAVSRLKRFDDAIKLFNQVIEQKAEDSDHGIKRIQNFALFEIASAYLNQKRYRQAIEQIMSALSIEPEPHDIQLKALISNARLQLGVAHQCLGEPDRALTEYESLIDTYIDGKDEIELDTITKALSFKANIHEDKKQIDEAISCYQKIIDILASEDAPNLLVRRETAKLNQANIFADTGSFEKAISQYQDIEHHDSEEAGLDHVIASAIFNRAITLGKTSEHESESNAYDQIYDRFQTNDDPDIQELVAKSLVNRGALFGRSGEYQSAIETYNLVVSRLEGATALPLRTQYAQALFNKGVTHKLAGETELELQTYNRLFEIFENPTEVDLQLPIASALNNKGILLAERKNYIEAIDMYDEITRRYLDTQDNRLRTQVARASYNRACAFAQLGNVDETINSLEQMKHTGQPIELSQIQQDQDFDLIKSNPTFTAYLERPR